MARVLQCPWLATNGLSRWCMNGRFPCNCESCDCSDKKYVEVYTTTNTAGTSDWPNYLKENQMEETEIKIDTLSESKLIDTRMYFENGRIYICEYPTVNGSKYMEKVDVTKEVAKAISQYINKEGNV